MGYEQILYEAKDRIATVTLNRPEKLNAWTGVMGREVRQAMDEAARDESVRVIILTGAGRGFCAGADMQLLSGIVDAGTVRESDERPARSASAADASMRADFRGPYAYFPTVPKPIIAALNGATAGLGLVIALYCDLRIAADAAVFTTAFSRRGLIAEHGVSWMLPRLVGLQHGLDLLLSARKISAAEALGMGLVSQVRPAASLMDDVRAYARDMADLVSPRSIRVMKRQIWEAQFQSLAEATAVAGEEMTRSFTSEDFKEGVAHFVEKRPPRFTGR
ncbi:MAG TPA: enoyl-CoA hydratase [Methylomirabilota bacterium]|jgi:enoyl-CoA hydratase/carnithine racemase|nr:enoyl-CoA hydratase [Methylomirabilota bacterium]